MNKRVKRSFIVGSEWLCYKIYTGHSISDMILTEIIKPITEKLIKNQVINKWFYIRYLDPEYHLRVRFLCEKKDINQIIKDIYKPLNRLIEQDLVWKVQLDTYNREIERYGENTMELSETLFYHDSNSIVQFLDLIEGDDGEELRWLFGLLSIDYLLDSFKYSLHEKLMLMNSIKTSFGNEFGMARPLKKQLDERYRKERENIKNFMVFSEETKPDYAPIINILRNKKESSQIAVQNILMLKKDKALSLDLNNLLGSYIHMQMNRLFKSKNRLNEMVCYDFLFRYYKTTYALNK